MTLIIFSILVTPGRCSTAFSPCERPDDRGLLPPHVITPFSTLTVRRFPSFSIGFILCSALRLICSSCDPMTVKDSIPNMINGHFMFCIFIFSSSFPLKSSWIFLLYHTPFSIDTAINPWLYPPLLLLFPHKYCIDHLFIVGTPEKKNHTHKTLARKRDVKRQFNGRSGRCRKFENESATALRRKKVYLQTAHIQSSTL